MSNHLIYFVLNGLQNGEELKKMLLAAVEANTDNVQGF